MFNKHKRIPGGSFFCLLGMVALFAGSGCQKYAPLQSLDNPAYFRVFNSITNTRRTALYTGTADELANTRLLCMLIDPQTDAGGQFSGGAQVGDFLCYRAFDAAPYETHPNDDISIWHNEEYPGAVRMPVGGMINGLDLSRWGQIKAGLHRMVFMRRIGGTTKDGRTYFVNYPASGRDSAMRVVLDTTVDLEANKVYTLDIVSASSSDPAPLRLLVRRERFDTDPLSDTSNIYVNFYNYLETAGSPDNLDVYYQWQYIINTIGPLQAPVTYSRDAYAGKPSGFNTDPESFLTTIKGKYNTTAPAYSAIAMPAAGSFYYQEGPAVMQYRLPFDRPRLLLNFYQPGQSAATGATPYLQIVCNEYNSQGVINVSPDAGLLNVSEDNNLQYMYAIGVSDGSPALASLYQTVTYNQVSHFFPMVNSITLMSQYSSPDKLATGVIKAFQVGLQRRYEAGLIR